MPYVGDRSTNWMAVEPLTTLMMIIAAIVLFGVSFARSKDDAPSRFFPWFRRVIEAAVTSFLFLGLLWAFRSILNSNRATFHSTHGSLSDAALNSAYTIWGRPHVQRELTVTHYIDTIVQEEIPREDPSLPPLYREVEAREVVGQNSILSFTGEINLALSERERGYGYYNGFEADCRFEYRVINDSDLETEAEFDFPLSSGQTMHENFQITVDGEDISSLPRIAADTVHWTQVMQPHEQITIVVAYMTRGMQFLYYQIPTQREIQDFTLTMTIDRLPTDMLNYPEGCLTPMEILPTADGEGSVLAWTLDRAITSAGMGVALPQPEQPGAKVLRVLQDSPYALTLLMATVSLTLLILGRPIQFLKLALLASVYCVEFLLMAAISDYFFGFWGSLVVGVALTSLLTWLLYRREDSKLLRILIAVLVAFFTIVYPLAGLLTDVTARNSFDSIVQVSLIVYLFWLSLYSGLKAKHAVEPSTAISG